MAPPLTASKAKTAALADVAKAAYSSVIGLPFRAVSGIWVQPSGAVQLGSGAVALKWDDILVGTDPRYPAATPTITFANPLPTGYRHLQIDWYARSDSGGINNTGNNLRLNSDAGANYDNQTVRFNAGVTTSAEALGATAINLGRIPAATATANYFGEGEAVIKNYAGITGNKLVLIRSNVGFDNLTTSQENTLNTSKWRTTATAITSVTLLPSAGNFVIGSLFTLTLVP